MPHKNRKTLKNLLGNVKSTHQLSPSTKDKINTGNGERASTNSCQRKVYRYDKIGVRSIYSPFMRFAQTPPLGYYKKPDITSNVGLTAKEKTYLINSCQTRTKRYIELKDIANKAIKEKKIFTINGCCQPVRIGLRERGWVEKLPTAKMNLSKLKNGSVNSKPEIQNQLETLLLSQLVQNHAATFIWYTSEHHHLNDIADSVRVNKLSETPVWTTKQGLCSSMKHNYWYYIEDVSEVACPRSYSASDEHDLAEFQRDFYLTACSNLLKWVVSMVCNKQPIFIVAGTISVDIFIFAINRCREYLFIKQNRDIDQKFGEIKCSQWKTFLKKSHKIIHGKEFFKLECDKKLPVYLVYSKMLLQEMHKYRVGINCEGYRNIWIVKPAFSSRGRGIKMASDLNSIKELLDKSSAKFVIQKYIEEPLLIYDTKFDIRQYYLITSSYPLVIWMYQDCYLKFSSQKFSLKKFNESIHLTNNAVQRKYTNWEGRNVELPVNNMWDLETYKKHLSHTGHEQVWEKIIYPGMRKSIINIMLSSQYSMGLCKNRFELFGCDFILDNTYEPWLIEINSRPDLKPTTAVTAKICPVVIADILKVVLDYPRHSKASTGKFECIYRQPMTLPKYNSCAHLSVQGYKLPPNYFYTGIIPLQKTIEMLSAKRIECLAAEQNVEEKNIQFIVELIRKYCDNMNDIVYTVDKSTKKSDANVDHLNQIKHELSTAFAVVSTPDQLASMVSDYSLLKILKSETTFGFSSCYSSDNSSFTRRNKSDLLGWRSGKIAESEKEILDFSEPNDGSMGNESTYCINEVKDLIELNLSKSSKSLYDYTTHSDIHHIRHKSKNRLLEATSEIYNFIREKENQYSCI